MNPHQVDAALFAFDSPLSKGALIADEYALLYEAPREQVATAGLLRAEAAALRDARAAKPDWDAIGDLLRQSYRELSAGITRVTARAASFGTPPAGG